MTSTRWIKHLTTEEDKARFTKRLVLVKDVFEVLGNIIKEDLETSQRKCRDESNFNLPEWGHFQAYQLGQQKALDRILSLINHKE